MIIPDKTHTDEAQIRLCAQCTNIHSFSHVISHKRCEPPVQICLLSRKYIGGRKNTHFCMNNFLGSSFFFSARVFLWEITCKNPQMFVHWTHSTINTFMNNLIVVSFCLEFRIKYNACMRLINGIKIWRLWVLWFRWKLWISI